MNQDVISVLSGLEAIARRRRMYFGTGDPRSILQELAAFASGFCDSVEITKVTPDHFIYQAKGIPEIPYFEDYLLSVPCGSMPVSTPVMTFAFAKRVVVDLFLLGQRWVIEDGAIVSTTNIVKIEGELFVNIYYK